VQAVQIEALDLVGDWPGVITANLHHCQSTGRKRAGDSQVATKLSFRGPYATTAATAVGSGMQDVTILGFGVSGEFVSLEDPNNIDNTDNVNRIPQPEETNVPTEPDHHLSGGAIAGIVFACLFGTGLLIVVVVAVFRPTPGMLRV